MIAMSTQGMLAERLPDAPPVPDGFDQIVRVLGDPRPLLSADGTLSATNRARWEEQTLARGTLPFPIPLDARNPAAGVKRTFYAHRKLVPTFERIFGEIDRLGLRGAITSWDGLYDFRPVRGTTRRLSLHAFGAALDLNAAGNALGEAGDMPATLIEIFEHFGFYWGGRFRGRRDPMHFQYAIGD